MSDGVTLYRLNFKKHLYPFMGYKKYLEEVQTIKDFHEVPVEYYLVEVYGPKKKEYYAVMRGTIIEYSFLLEFLSIEEYTYEGRTYHVANVTRNKELIEFVGRIINVAESLCATEGDCIGLGLKVGEDEITTDEEPDVYVSRDTLPIDSEIFSFLYNKFRFFRIIALMDDKLIYSKKNKIVISKLITASKTKVHTVENRLGIIIHIASIREDREFVELLEHLTKAYRRQILEIEEKYWKSLTEKIESIIEEYGLSDEILSELEKYRLSVSVSMKYDSTNYVEFTVFGQRHVTNDVFSQSIIDAIIYRIYSSLLWATIDYIEETYECSIDPIDIILPKVETSVEIEEEEEEFEEYVESESLLDKLKRLFSRG